MLKMPKMSICDCWLCFICRQNWGILQKMPPVFGEWEKM